MKALTLESLDLEQAKFVHLIRSNYLNGDNYYEKSSQIEEMDRFGMCLRLSQEIYF